MCCWKGCETGVCYALIGVYGRQLMIEYSWMMVSRYETIRTIVVHQRVCLSVSIDQKVNITVYLSARDSYQASRSTSSSPSILRIKMPFLLFSYSRNPPLLLPNVVPNNIIFSFHGSHPQGPIPTSTRLWDHERFNA